MLFETKHTISNDPCSLVLFPKDYLFFLVFQVRSLNINKSTKKQTTAISVASQRGHLDIVALFVNRYDCDINICDWNGFSPLYIASQRGHHAVVRSK